LAEKGAMGGGWRVLVGTEDRGGAERFWEKEVETHAEDLIPRFSSLGIVTFVSGAISFCWDGQEGGKGTFLSLGLACFFIFPFLFWLFARQFFCGLRVSSSFVKLVPCDYYSGIPFSLSGQGRVEGFCIYAPRLQLLEVGWSVTDVDSLNRVMGLSVVGGR